VAITVLLAGCAAAERVAGVPAAPAGVHVVAVQAAGCAFNIEGIEDVRENRDLGFVGFTQVGGERFGGWFREGVAAIPGHSVEPAALKMHVELTRAYIHSVASMKSANLIARVRLSGGRTPMQRTYRGVDSSLNWSSSEREVQAAFEGAMADLRRQLAADIDGLCRGQG
jgi:hypothetical protein